MLFYLLAALGLVPTFQKTKCKKLLIITLERIKLLEKRRQARVRQLYRDVIELLLLRKENKIESLLVRIWKELCLFSVYAKIAEYCGFVQINLKDIAAQRECPTGLEEPLAGLCFAASCCADLPELQELREIFAMKYGKQIASSGQDLEPNCHVNHQLLDCLYAKEPSEAEKQAVLDDIIAKYNAMQGHWQDTQHRYLCDYVSTEGSVDLNECNHWKKGIEYTMEVSEVQHQVEYGESEGVDVVQELNPLESEGVDLVSMELGNEIISRKRALEHSEMCHSGFKRANRRGKLWSNKGIEGEENRGKERKQQSVERAHDSGTGVASDAGKKLVSEQLDGHERCGILQITAHVNKAMMPSEDQHIVYFVNPPLCSYPPPQRPPPPPPPPKRAPPPPTSLRVISMPRCGYDKQVHDANAILPRRCSTMAQDYHVGSYGSHVHPRLPKHEDLVANFTALKG